MAISRSMRPRLLVAGTVQSVAELKRKADKSVYGTEVVLAQENGAFPSVRFFDNQGTHVPAVGEYFAAVVEVEESREFGAQLTFVEPPYSALDALHSALSASAGK